MECSFARENKSSARVLGEKKDGKCLGKQLFRVYVKTLNYFFCFFVFVFFVFVFFLFLAVGEEKSEYHDGAILLRLRLPP